MSESSNRNRTVRCACGGVELETIGSPIISNACYCDDCQEAAAELEGLPSAPPVLDGAGGTEFLLFRKDRMKYIRGERLLWNHRLKGESPTRRVVASCCNSFLFLDFQNGHWFSICRSCFEGNVPPPQMRIQTKFKPEGTNVPDNAPAYSGLPIQFVAKLMLAKVAMWLPR